MSFAGGSLSEEATILFVAPGDDGWLVVTDRSPFHPLGLSWPDQPGDHGTLTLPDGGEHPVADSWTGFVDADDGTLVTEADAMEVSRSGVRFQAVVLHLVRTDADLTAAVRGRARLDVAPTRRAALSLQHTGVHLAALALNRASDRFWTKPYADRDDLGSANFDKAAVTGSAIEEDRSVDTYRIGKSLRKKGVDRDALLAALPEVENAINENLREILPVASTRVELSPAEGRLGDRRVWRTVLRGVEVSIPCGGTHVDDLSRVTEISVRLGLSDDGFTMVTRTR